MQLEITTSSGEHGFAVTGGRVSVEQYIEDGVQRNRAVLTGTLAQADIQTFWSILPADAECTYVFGSYSGRGFNAGSADSLKYVIKAIPVIIGEEDV